MNDETAVLFANESFYAAFGAGDFEAMSNTWSETAPVSCIHPGWESLHGRDLVLESWRGILGNAARPEVRINSARASILGNTAIVVCNEQVEDGFLIATNVFVREGKIWKMVHHQAGPLPTSYQPAEAPEPGRVQ